MDPRLDAGYPVTQHDRDDANGVASIVGTLLGQNLEAHPDRVSTARRMRSPVAVFSTDTDSAATVVFGPQGATVYNDLVKEPTVIVMATVDQILDVAQLQMRAGGLAPVGFASRRGLLVLRQILTHQLVVRGLLVHPIRSLRFISLVSIAS